MYILLAPKDAVEMAEKWKNGNLRTCVAVSDVLGVIFDALGELPEGRTPKNLGGETTAGELFDYAERVANDDELWASLPARIVPSDAKKERMRSAMTQILALPNVVNAEAAEDVLAEAEEGVSRDEQRQYLRRVLDECR